MLRLTRFCLAKACTCTLGAFASILAAETVMELLIHRTEKKNIVHNLKGQNVLKFLIG